MYPRRGLSFPFKSSLKDNHSTDRIFSSVLFEIGHNLSGLYTRIVFLYKLDFYLFMFYDIAETFHKSLDLFLDIFLFARPSKHDFLHVVFFYDASNIEIHHFIVDDIADGENDVASFERIGESDISRPSIDTEDGFGLAVICLHN